MGSEHKPLYPYSLEEAVRNNEKALWRESYRENCTCANAIDRLIAENYDGQYLGQGLAQQAIEQYGFDRVNFVLANTVNHYKDDGRISRENKNWAEKWYIPDEKHTQDYALNSHPGLTNLFINQARKAWQALGLFDASHCVDGRQDYTGKVVVLKPDVLRDEFKTPKDQLFLASHGNGCKPNAIGRKVFGQFLSDGEKTHFCRDKILGVIRDEYLPEWAKEKLLELAPPGENESKDLTMGGMQQS